MNKMTIVLNGARWYEHYMTDEVGVAFMNGRRRKLLSRGALLVIESESVKLMELIGQSLERVQYDD